MTVPLDVLSQARIASPCPMRWDDLTGDGAVRSCDRCALKVHNLSEMSAEDASALLASKKDGERLCVAFYRRDDGTIMTRDCPVGLRAARLRIVRVATRIAAVLGMLATGGMLFAGDRAGRSQRLASAEPFSTVRDVLNPTPAPPPLLGEVCVPIPAPTNGAGATPQPAGHREGES